LRKEQHPLLRIDARAGGRRGLFLRGDWPRSAGKITDARRDPACEDA
jgi:hypothetical protein